MTHATTRTRLGLALAMGLAGLAGAGRAQEAPAADPTDLGPPDMGAPPGDGEHRTCPDREDRPEWVEGLEGYEAERGLLLMSIYEARTFEAIIASDDCSCEIKAPPWDEAEAEYQADYAALDLPAVDDAEDRFSALSRSLYRDARRICREQGNW